MSQSHRGQFGTSSLLALLALTAGSAAAEPLPPLRINPGLLGAGTLPPPAAPVVVDPVVAAYDFTPFQTIVDVGGGHGRLLAAITKATPLRAVCPTTYPRSWKERRSCWARVWTVRTPRTGRQGGRWLGRQPRRVQPWEGDLAPAPAAAQIEPGR